MMGWNETIQQMQNGDEMTTQKQDQMPGDNHDFAVAGDWYGERVDHDSGEIVYELHHAERDSMIVFHGPNAKADREVVLSALRADLIEAKPQELDQRSYLMGVMDARMGKAQPADMDKVREAYKRIYEYAKNFDFSKDDCDLVYAALIDQQKPATPEMTDDDILALAATDEYFTPQRIQNLRGVIIDFARAIIKAVK